MAFTLEELQQKHKNSKPKKVFTAQDLRERTNIRDRRFFGETIQDIKEIGTGISERFQERVGKTQEIGEAQQQGKQGRLRSLFQRLGQGAGLVSDVIGETVIGAGKALLPQRAEEAVGGAVESAVGRVAETDSVQNLIQRYQQLKETNPELARDIDATLGISTLALDVATAGAGGNIARTGVRGATKAGELVGKGVGKVGAGARRIGFELEGALTGTSQETLEAAFQAAKRGGNQLDELTRNLRSEVTPERLVENVRSSAQLLEAKKTTDFKNALAEIANETVDSSAVRNSFISRLDEFGIKVTDNGLDFSASKFRQTPQAQNKIKQAFQEIENLSGTNTLLEIDTTRQVLRELLLTGDDASARSANAVITQAIDDVRTAGKQVNGYEDMLLSFADDAEFLNEISRSLATRDTATIDTAYRRLATSLKTNNERRMRLLNQLDEATDGALLSGISGQQLSEALPRGLFRQIAAGIAGAGVVSGGISTSLIPALVFASPRVAGEFVRALGLTAQKTKILIEAIGEARKVIDKLNVPVPLASPASQSLEQNDEDIQQD